MAAVQWQPLATRQREPVQSIIQSSGDYHLTDFTAPPALPVQIQSEFTANWSNFAHWFTSVPLDGAECGRRRRSCYLSAMAFMIFI